MPDSTPKPRTWRDHCTSETAIAGIFAGVTIAGILGAFALVVGMIAQIGASARQQQEIHREVHHRLRFALRAMNKADKDVNLARKRLNAVEPEYTLYSQWQNARLSDLLAALKSLDDGAVDHELITLSSDPQITEEGFVRLMGRLEQEIPLSSWWQPSRSGYEYLRSLSWPLVVLILGGYAIHSHNKRVAAASGKELAASSI